MRLTNAWGYKQEAYETIEEALEAYRAKYLVKGDKLNPSDEVSLGIGCDCNGKYWFAVGYVNDFTNCTVNDLTNDNKWFSWLDWFEEDWIEKEEDL